MSRTREPWNQVHFGDLCVRLVDDSKESEEDAEAACAPHFCFGGLARGDSKVHLNLRAVPRKGPCEAACHDSPLTLSRTMRASRVSLNAIFLRPVVQLLKLFVHSTALTATVATGLDYRGKSSANLKVAGQPPREQICCEGFSKRGAVHCGPLPWL